MNLDQSDVLHGDDALLYVGVMVRTSNISLIQFGQPYVRVEVWTINTSLIPFGQPFNCSTTCLYTLSIDTISFFISSFFLIESNQ